jgi:DNA-binding transcriptional LysR family regulator
MIVHHLESFLAVVEDGSIAGASRRLNLTPSAVAQRLKALESDLGVRLVSRSGRTVRPTNAGDVLTSRARTLVQDVSSLRRLFAHGLGCSLRLGAVPSSTVTLIPDLLLELAEAHPELEVTVLCGESAELRDAILRHELDAAVSVGGSARLPKSCSWAALGKQRLVVLANSKLGAVSAVEVLESRPLIRFGRDGTSLADLYLSRAGLRPRVLACLESYDAIRRLVAADLGVSIVPDWIASPSDGTIHLPLIDAENSQDLGLLWICDPARVSVMQTMISRLGRSLAAPGKQPSCSVTPRSGRFDIAASEQVCLAMRGQIVERTAGLTAVRRQSGWVTNSDCRAPNS